MIVKAEICTKEKLPLKIDCKAHLNIENALYIKIHCFYKDGLLHMSTVYEEPSLKILISTFVAIVIFLNGYD